MKVSLPCFLQQAENALSTYAPDALVLVFSVVSSDSLREAEETLQYLWRTNSANDKAVILVGNKTDLVRTRTVNIVGELGFTVQYSTQFKFFYR